jgi:hypothetical protein
MRILFGTLIGIAFVLTACSKHSSDKTAPITISADAQAVLTAHPWCALLQTPDKAKYNIIERVTFTPEGYRTDYLKFSSGKQPILYENPELQKRDAKICSVFRKTYDPRCAEVPGNFDGFLVDPKLDISIFKDPSQQNLYKKLFHKELRPTEMIQWGSSIENDSLGFLVGWMYPCAEMSPEVFAGAQKRSVIDLAYMEGEDDPSSSSKLTLARPLQWDSVTSVDPGAQLCRWSLDPNTSSVGVYILTFGSKNMIGHEIWLSYLKPGQSKVDELTMNDYELKSFVANATLDLVTNDHKISSGGVEYPDKYGTTFLQPIVDAKGTRAVVSYSDGYKPRTLFYPGQIFFNCHGPLPVELSEFSKKYFNMSVRHDIKRAEDPTHIIEVE